MRDESRWTKIDPARAANLLRTTFMASPDVSVQRPVSSRSTSLVSPVTRSRTDWLACLADLTHVSRNNTPLPAFVTVRSYAVLQLHERCRYHSGSPHRRYLEGFHRQWLLRKLRLKPLSVCVDGSDFKLRLGDGAIRSSGPGGAGRQDGTTRAVG